MKQILTIAGSDSGGGAGIQADIKSIHANGGFAISAITSVTAQNTCEVTSAFDLPIEIIEAQIDTVFADFEISAVKTGMLSNAEIVQAVAKKLGQYSPKNIVVDPVMISKSGFPLLQEPAIETIISSLIPLATILTPNVHEAQLLSNMTIQNVTEAKAAAKKIHQIGCHGVLIKGGHMEDETSVDVLFSENKFQFFESERINTKNTHGTGCTYSAAIATQLGLGKSLSSSIESAKDYITNAIRHSLEIGHGHGPTNHFYFL